MSPNAKKYPVWIDTIKLLANLIESLTRLLIYPVSDETYPSRIIFGS